MLGLSEWQFLLSLTTGVEIRKGRLMKLLYTDMSQDLTEILTEQATSYAQKGPDYPSKEDFFFNEEEY